MRASVQELRCEIPAAVELTASLTRRAAIRGLTGYINAGGMGTRLNPIFTADPRRGVSKAILEVGVPPIPLINHHINKLDAAGVPVIVAGVGDHGNVADHVRAEYREKSHIHAIEAETQLGNGGDLVMAARTHRDLFAGRVLVANVDTILDINEAELTEQHEFTGAGLTIALTENRGVPNEDAYYVGYNSAVVYCAEATTMPPDDEVAEYTSYRASSTGALVVEGDLLRDMSWSPDDGPLSLYRDIVGFALGQGAVYGYNNGTRTFIDVGTVDTWNAIQAQPELIQPLLAYGTEQ
jgi:NDP-sugar pyrophosphorylase family protein